MLKKAYKHFVVGFVVSAAAVTSNAALLGEYTFTGTGTPPSTSASSTAANVSFSGNFGITGTGLSYLTSTDVLQVDGWPTAQDATKYVSFTITPSSGYQLSGLSLAFGANRGYQNQSQNGPATITVEALFGSSAFSQSYSLNNNPADYQSFVFSPAMFPGVGQAVTFKFSGFGGQGKSENWLAFDTVSLDGVSAVPEPVNIALAGFGLLAAGSAMGRRYFKKARE